MPNISILLLNYIIAIRNFLYRSDLNKPSRLFQNYVGRPS
ncbi:hypothetical protein EBME_2251 [bacterium endosymbiont of Mortierella elongata FMR23-6]|nr:hypothetical protein EBME_2251 [bacterium endosymbiont of Mortierella elongata FMR23-6]